jgi:hypothetical protein
MNEALRNELLAMRAEDESTRARRPGDDALFREYTPAMRAVHDRNADRLAEIVRAQGWPTRTEVGPDGAEAAWLVAMHALGRKEFMLAWAWDMAAAAQAGEASPAHVAVLTDRTRVLRGKEQIYGTQLDWDPSGTLSPLPITQPETVDVRRESVLLEPLADYVAGLRARAGSEGEGPPPDPAARRARYEAFLRETGWRK